MKFSIPQVRENFITDYTSAKLSTDELISKYKFSSRQDLYQTTCELRKAGLLPKTTLSEAISKYYAKKKKTSVDHSIKTSSYTNQPATEYRTVYFKDFTVQIHKKAMARLVVDYNNNIHILNS